MNKKALIFILTALTLTPIAMAGITRGMEDMLGVIFNATGDLAYIKAGMWLVVFLMIFKSAERIFPYNRGMAVIISLVFSTLAARFTPDEYMGYLGWWFIVIIILGIPFFIGSFFGDLFRLRRGGKTIFIIALYVAEGYFIMKWRDLGIGGPASDVLDVAFTWISEHSVIVLIIIAILCIIFLFRGGGGGGTAPTGIPGGPRPSFWRGLGRGTINSGMALQGWIARKRAAAKMRWAIREAHRRRPPR